MEVFMRLYYYTLFDLIPGLEIVKTLHLKSPVEAHDFIAGCPILAFRVLVLWILLNALKRWYYARKESGRHKPGDAVFLAGIAVYALFFL